MFTQIKKITAKLLSILFISIFILNLSGCIYQPEFTQGNVITPAQVAQIKPGMTQSDVQVIMGTPVLTNTFSNNRWNYVYTLQKGSHVKQYQRVIIHFDHGVVSQVET